MTAVRTTIDTVKEEGLIANAMRVGDLIRNALRAWTALSRCAAWAS